MTNISALGGLVKRIGNYDRMETFSGRLKLQKTIYLMEHAFDLNIGYNFSWYVRGPYSPQLAEDGFGLKEVYDTIPVARFKENDAEIRFREFLSFLGGKKDDADWLEIVASIHFLKTVYPNASKEWILQKVKDKQHYFTLDQCATAWDYLEKCHKM